MRQTGFNWTTGLKGNKNNVTLDGFDEFLNLIKEMPDKMKIKAMSGIIRKNLKPVAAAIKANTPVRKSTFKGTVIRKRKDGSVSTKAEVGNLKASIGVKTFRSQSKGVTGYAGINNGKVSEEDDNLFRTKDGWYGFFLERGTKKIPKNPFISRAAAMSVPLASESLQTDIKNYIVDNAKKLGLDAK